MINQTYFIKHGIRKRNQRGYVLVKGDNTRPVFQSDSKTEVIAESQRRNGYTPVDGDETTYFVQTHEQR